MGTCWHLLSNELFSSRIPGAPPTEAERSDFKSPRLRKGMLEKEIYPELGKVIESVLDAAGCEDLLFLATTNHKANDGNSGRKETFNDAGIYLNTSLARNATTFTAEHRKGSKMSEKELETRLLGLRSWHWMDVPIEVKGTESESAFYFRSKARGMRPEGVKEAREVVEKAEEEADDEVKTGDGNRDGVEDVGDGIDADEDEDEEDIEDHSEVEVDEEDGDDDDDDDDEDADDSQARDADSSMTQAESTDAPQPETVKKHVPPFIKLSGNGGKALGRFIEYMLNVFKYQHRTFCYAVYVCYDMARLLFFDRSGVHVSEPFSWVETTSLLHEFVWKLAKLANAKSFEDLGRDTTANVVDEETRRRFLDEATNAELPSYVREGLEKAAKGNCPLYELEIEYMPPSPEEWFPDEPFPDEPLPSPSARTAPSSSTSSASPSSSKSKADPPIRKFIVGRPHFSADALVGRCTKGFMAFDVTDKNNWVPCFVKDSWRPYVPGRTRPEHLVYERLRRKGVKPKDGIATLICGGDVGGSNAQCTQVQEDLPSGNRPAPRRHYRVAIAEICLPVSKFRTFGELSGIFADTLRAHRKAWDRSGVLHRDISVGNIMIRVESNGGWTGILIDWDLSKLQCELGLGAVEPSRTGTWQFMSAMSLRYPRKPYRRSDDIESFIHCYIYLVFRYHPTDVGLREKIESLFEGCLIVGGVMIGGNAKRAMLRSGHLGAVVKRNPRLQRLLDDILWHCKSCYDMIDYVEMDRLYGPIEDTEQSQPETEEDVLTSADQGPRRTTALRHSSDEGSSAEDLDEDPIRTMSRQRQEARALSHELFEMGPFLSNPKMLMNLLLKHAETTFSHRDKAPDQFSLRQHQEVYRAPDPPALRGIGSMSAGGTTLSGRMSQDNRYALSHDKLTTTRRPGIVGIPSSYSSSRKRAHVEKQDDNLADDEGDGSPAVRRSKRFKTAKGKAPSVQSGTAKRR
ncbi:hypothetical protein DICSQDRAFT_139753 [Dichomitus squalens LYAD-421 SS1]|uniref:Fungal-type protein kinase domain-containing protein n=1 Tax=Dichomitus squalens (strain LYAD-421) TaxID=732165 RepID=R7SQS8_DICSQ|nr:uncharacterized protein DICSQDRAFT_139753 [Dichomitus squalens LYAD-421 SS1]EJF58110.1 hypothetical protein DICSQDRAFT_139753 [Dichomitus squalens LYAD-421 SS1]